MIKKLISYRMAAILLALLLAASIGIAVTIIKTRAITGWEPWLLGLGMVLLISLVASLIHRARKELNRNRNGTDRFRHYGRRRHISLLQGDVEWYPRLRHILRSSGWKVPNGSDKQQFIVERGRAGVWGSLVFHSGLAVLILGILISLALGFRGMFALTEGETFVEGQDPYRNVSSGILVSSADMAPLEIMLEDFDPQFPIAATTTEASQLRFRDSDGRYREMVYFNHGLKLAEGELHQQRWGYSPGMIIQDPQGEVVLNGFVRLASQKGRGGVYHRDEIRLANGTQLTFELMDSPAAGTTNGVEPVEKRPMLDLSLNAGSEELFRGRLKVGETAQLGGYLVAFPQYRYWAQYELVRDPSLPILISGVILVIFGLLARITFVRQRLAVSFREGNAGTVITLSGWSEKYPASFEENLNALTYQMKTDLQANAHRIEEPEILKTLSEPSHATC